MITGNIVTKRQPPEGGIFIYLDPPYEPSRDMVDKISLLKT